MAIRPPTRVPSGTGGRARSGVRGHQGPGQGRPRRGASWSGCNGKELDRDSLTVTTLVVFESTAEELRRVRVRLDGLVESRLLGGFTPAMAASYQCLVRRGGE